MKNVAVVMKKELKTKSVLLKKIKGFGFTVVEQNPDFVISIGGDGTYLEAELRYPGVPKLAINAGNLGYLTQGTVKELGDVLADIKKRKFSLETREKLTLYLNGKNVGSAVNDIVISNSVPGKAIRMNIYIDSEQIANLICDGLIVATPTGSTGYNVSVGGSVLEPGSGVFIISPINAHLSKFRPLTVSNKHQIQVELIKESIEPVITLDGVKELSISKKDKIILKKSTTKAKIISMNGFNYFKTLNRLFS